MLPRLRDNEWIIFNDYDQCVKENKMYTLLGLGKFPKIYLILFCIKEDGEITIGEVKIGDKILMILEIWLMFQEFFHKEKDLFIKWHYWMDVKYIFGLDHNWYVES